MPTIRNYGVGTGYTSNGITGAKSSFAYNEKVYACHVWDELVGNEQLRIVWERKVAGAWKQEIVHEWTNQGYASACHWCWMQNYPPGEWRVNFWCRISGPYTTYFTIKEPPAPPAVTALTIASNPTGAKIFLNDTDTLKITPYTFSVSPGRYLFRVEKAGYEPSSVWADAEEGKTKTYTLGLTAIPVVTALTINSDPTGANIFIDGKDTGKITSSTFTLAPGRYLIRVEKAGYKESSVYADAESGKTKTYTLGLVPFTAINIESEPTGANIFIDGIDMKKKTPSQVEVVEGTREIKLTLSGYKDFTRMETVIRGKVLSVKYTLERVPSPFEIAWNSLKGNIAAGNWIEAAKNLIALPFVSILPTDDKVLMGEVPITPVPSGIDPSIIAKLGPKLTIWGRITQIFKSLASAAKANPFIAIFAATEIPQLAVMTTFAFKWLAEQKGETLTSVSISLNNLYSAWEAAGYKFSTAVKNKDFIGAANLLGEMMNLTTEYDNILLDKKDVLTKAGEYEARAAISDMMKAAVEEMKKSVGVSKLPETIRVFVRDITDGDTIETDIKGYDNATGNEMSLPALPGKTHAGIRLVGINAPEKSPKGEILCSEIEIYKVEKKYADYARDILLPLNDRQVILYIDPEKQLDGYGRILAVVSYEGKDIGLEQIKRGFACWYFREKHKYVNDDLYKSETLAARAAKKGMWSEVPEELVPIEEEPIIFSIDSIPSNAKVIIDGVETHHNTPTNETEQKDVISLWTPGKHILKIIKSGMEKEVEIDLVRGKRLELVVDLTAMPPPEEVPVVPGVPVVPPVEVGKIMFSINSTPANAKVWIDEIYTRHLTPTDEKEQKDVINLWTAGKHKLRLDKAGYAAEQEITLIPGQRLTLTLELKGMVTPVVPVVPVVPEVPVVPPVAPPVIAPPATIQAFFNIIKTYYVGRLYLSKKELIELGEIYGLDISGL